MLKVLSLSLANFHPKLNYRVNSLFYCSGSLVNTDPLFVE